MNVYYNENDSYAAQWLRNLIAAGQLPAGVVDERSIADVQPDDLEGYIQCHFFAGIGGWSLALRQAGWPDDRPVWTGSCPCQPFSAAGKGAGFADERHLWPAFFHLIKECRPVSVFGEQVASKDTNPWFDLVQADLESMGYAFGCVPFAAAGVGAPHPRERAYWVADSDHSQKKRQQQYSGQGLSVEKPEGLAGGSCHDWMDDSKTSIRRRARREDEQWREADWLFCRDGKWRPVEPGTFPLASGVSNRVGRLRGYGNSIVVPQAEEFIRAYMKQPGSAL